jgi:VWFA-related protein
MQSLPRHFRARRAPRLAAATIACLLFAAAPNADLRTVAAASAETRTAQPARAQQSLQPQYTIQARVPLTIVDVTVTDAKGNPVHGLKQSDFTILEDKQEMKPNSFEEHRSDEPPPAAALVKQDLPPNTFTNSTAAPPSSGPLNILLLDELNTGAQAQQLVTRRMIVFVSNMKPGTQMAVFRLTTHLSILQGFTADRELLKAALNSKNNFAWPSLVPDVIPGDEPASTPGEAVEREGNLTYTRGEYTLSAMRQIARYLSGMPGRKNLIWFSGSFPLQFPPVQDPLAFPSNAYPPNCNYPKCPPPPSRLPASQMYDFTEELKSSTDLLVRAHVAIYTIDWRGPRVLGNDNRGEMISSERGTMQDMADQTGGKFFYNTNDYAGAVEQSIDNGSNFYTLTYAPTNQALDTRFRTITVKVDQPGVHLDYRNGYYAVDPTVDARGKKIETVSPMQSALMRGALDATQILFKVKATEAPATEVSHPIHNVPDRKQMKPPFRRISITYTIDLSNIQFTPSPDGNLHAAFEYGIRVYNADGDEIVNSAVKEAHPILSATAYQSMLKTGAIAHDEIDVPAKGDYFLRIAVHDLTTDRVGSMEIPVSSIKSETAPAVASAPNP